MWNTLRGATKRVKPIHIRKRKRDRTCPHSLSYSLSCLFHTFISKHIISPVSSCRNCTWMKTKNQNRFLSPTQLPIHGQWWSWVATQWSHYLQCLHLKGCSMWQMVQYLYSMKRTTSSSSDDWGSVVSGASLSKSTSISGLTADFSQDSSTSSSITSMFCFYFLSFRLLEMSSWMSKDPSTSWWSILWDASKSYTSSYSISYL